ncbi:FtsX-like permease family protein [Haloferula rosea]|uniref:ABC transporter permease n=1 Tax=Haloferula rosea TaxID=490093 RepID=A0A934RCJ9_9BACT|nr:FtsX-like permease family protein [Haloferula rosea]MBK1828188.1 ABC transporter permease [Haloferula rosea]
MARRSFSLMLAWRYLNPRRAMLSAVALISVSGVMLGVLVLVVVMSVYNGLEREVKGRLLGFIPHVRLDYAPMGGFPMPVADWRETSEQVAKLPGIQEAGPFVQDSLLIDIHSYRSAGSFRGVDTENPLEVEGIRAMLDTEAHPESAADMGLDDKVVISSKVARSFGAGVGDTIRLLTLRNFEEVERVFEKTKAPPVREKHAQALAAIRKQVADGWAVRGEVSELSKETFNAIYESLMVMYEDEPAIREAEFEFIHQAVMLIDVAEENAITGKLVLGKEAPTEFLAILDELNTTDVEKMDAAVLKSVEEIVLPKEAEIIGVYQSSQMALTPDVFMPLHLAQDLAGIGDKVQGIGVRLDDPYQAGVVAQMMMKELPMGWYPVTWITELSDFSRLIEQQRVMMYFALSFIILVSAFSMTAVMFTVTIQKRREIGVMKALGAAPGQIVWVFVYQGMILGAAGSAIGIGLGLLVIRFREGIQGFLRQFGFDPFPASFNGFNVLPAYVNPTEIGIIGVAAFLLCAGAAFLPAFFAARSDAARSLRNL